MARQAKYQRDIDDLDRQIAGFTVELRRMRSDRTAQERQAQAAKEAKENAMEQAEPIRESLAYQEPDSGRIVVYEECIEVPCYLT